jgi:hypothetical protein
VRAMASVLRDAVGPTRRVVALRGARRSAVGRPLVTGGTVEAHEGAPRTASERPARSAESGESRTRAHPASAGARIARYSETHFLKSPTRGRLKVRYRRDKTGTLKLKGSAPRAPNLPGHRATPKSATWDDRSRA